MVNGLFQLGGGRIGTKDSKRLRIRGSREESSLHCTASEDALGLGGLEGFAWNVYVLLSNVDGPCGRCMVLAISFMVVVDGNQSVTGPMDFGKDSGRGLGGPTASIWTTMIPRYSFPAAQQAQISERSQAHS